MNHARDMTFGIAVGAGLMFLLDPRRGNARRAMVRQQSVRAAHEVENAFGIGKRDLEHRARGIASLAFGKRRPVAVPDDVLVARVRSRLGRVCSHPHVVEVASKGAGVVELKGPVLRSDLDRTLAGVARVRGVRAIDDDLDVHDVADITALRGNDRRWGQGRSLTPATRLVVGLTAAGLAVALLVKGHPLGLLAGVGLVVGLARSTVHRGQRPSAYGKEAIDGIDEERPLDVEPPIVTESEPPA